jgi:3-hydroxyisobutyrate dehydrogenase-like beta-hydroxyacid dehydrogenase
MNTLNITFIGFGEVGSIFSDAFHIKNAKVSAYDILMDQQKGMEILKKRARFSDISFLPLSDALENADYILSTVTTHAAKETAESCSRYLKPPQVYIDLNATAPSVKNEVANIIRSAGANFVEGAILGAVGVTGAQTRILTGGPQGRKAAETLTHLGLNAVFYSSEIGKASSFKMLRSVFSKGLEALLLEFLIAGKRAGIQQDLWREITELFAQNPFDRIAANWIQTHAIAYERRYHEMKQVSAVLKEMGLDAILTSGTEAFFKRSCGLDFINVFSDKPSTMAEVIEFMEKQL